MDTGGLEVEQRTQVTQTPHPSKQINIKIKIMEQEQEPNEANQEDTIKIYTDGSKIEEKVGAAISIWEKGRETKATKLKLASVCSVYQAELLAIHKATEEIYKHKGKNFIIYSDSRAALQTIEGRTNLHPLALKTKEKIKEITNQNKTIDLIWIKAHKGLVGNERADQLAKEAALKLKTKPNYDMCPVSFAKRSIRMRSLEEWNRRYKADTTAKITKIFFPDAINAYQVIRKINPIGIITQVMTGHGGFSEYLNRFGCKESPSCICEPDKQENIPHILLECPVHALERYNTEQKMETKIEVDNIKDIMTNTNNRPIFINYCEKIATKVIQRNKTR